MPNSGEVIVSLKLMRLLNLALLFASSTFVQAQEYTRADTLRGTLSAERACYDVNFYDLDIQVDSESRSISGSNTMEFKAVSTFDSLQLDLFENMIIDSILFGDSILSYRREFNAVFVQLGRPIVSGDKGRMEIFHHGEPTVAKNAPWDGGFVWKTDNNGKPWIGVACEGDGASLWWPNKDHLSDEPDSMRISVTVPDSLMAICNGNLESVDTLGSNFKYNWFISYPINNYNVTLNVADYAHFSDVHIQESGDSLQLDYYVLKDNLAPAKEQFLQVHQTLKSFENAFGPYPFPNDGYALVETPYLGMEHQGAIAYGNRFDKGYRGRYPADMDFDYIIIHETGHEWWGNSVSANDLADMWIHESFCTYSESVYVEDVYGYQKMLDYLAYQKGFINNRTAVQGPYGVNRSGNGTDQYYKGAWMIHTLRNVIGSDPLFKQILKELALNFRHSNVDAVDVIRFINDRVEEDLSGFFKQYLNVARLPVLEYRIKRRKFFYRWDAVEGFDMPVEIKMGEIDRMRINPTSEWATIEFKPKMLRQLEFRTDLFLFEPKRVSDKK